MMYSILLADATRFPFGTGRIQILGLFFGAFMQNSACEFLSNFGPAWPRPPLRGWWETVSTSSRTSAAASLGMASVLLSHLLPVSASLADGYHGGMRWIS
jgi:hypothetical protein